MLDKYKEAAMKSFPNAANEEEALSLLLQMYERHTAERNEALNLVAAQATKLAQNTKDNE